MASKKNHLEIDLNENLRRRREELRGKIEAFEGIAPHDGGNPDLESRKTELSNLKKLVEELTAKIDGESQPDLFLLGTHFG